MLQDATALGAARQNWAGVEALRSKLRVSAFASMGLIGGSFPFLLANAAHNLPFVHAYAVLNDVLEQLASENDFAYRGRSLGKLLEEAETALPWQDFAAIKAGHGRRNDVAHRGDLLERDDCWKYVDAVKVELCSWGIL